MLKIVLTLHKMSVHVAAGAAKDGNYVLFQTHFWPHTLCKRMGCIIRVFSKGYGYLEIECAELPPFPTNPCDKSVITAQVRPIRERPDAIGTCVLCGVYCVCVSWGEEKGGGSDEEGGGGVMYLNNYSKRGTPYVHLFSWFIAWCVS